MKHRLIKPGVPFLGKGMLVLLLTLLPTPEAVAQGIISTVAGNGTATFGGDDGPATSASLSFPFGVAVDTAGNLFIADRSNLRVRRVDATTGIITTVAGNGTAGFSGDGGPATSASLLLPMGVAVDTSGNIFIADQFNHRIRRVDVTTGFISTVAGNGTGSFSGDGGLATSASLAFPSGVAVDATGNIFIADQDNHRIRRVDAATGIISTVAGNGTADSSGDGGPATSASLNRPARVALDAAGSLFIADQFNQSIRRVDAATGFISTVAGIGSCCFNGDNIPATSARLGNPFGVAVDTAGNIFIADSSNSRIRRVDATTGIITTAAGNGVFGFSGDGGPATSASISVPLDVAVDTAGNFFLVDEFNHRIRRVILVTTVSIDIKPGSDSNAVAPADSGLIPVAILSTDTFDATTISPSTVKFGSGEASMAHTSAHLEDVDNDSDLDLMLHFLTQQAGIQCGDTDASLTGQTFDGEPIQGSDGIITVGCS